MEHDPFNLRHLPRLPPRIDDLPLSEHKPFEQVQQQWRFEEDGQSFDFQNGRIVVNDQDLAYFMTENLTHLSASYWTNLSKRLHNYRHWAVNHARDPEMLAQLAALIQAFLAKIMGRVKRKLDETIDGVAFHLENGQLLLNGVNVNALIRLAKQYPENQRGKIFLKGLKQRMLVLLKNPYSNNEYEKIRDVIEGFIATIDEMLGEKPLRAITGKVILLKDLKPK